HSTTVQTHSHTLTHSSTVQTHSHTVLQSKERWKEIDSEEERVEKERSENNHRRILEPWGIEAPNYHRGDNSINPLMCHISLKGDDPSALHPKPSSHCAFP